MMKKKFASLLFMPLLLMAIVFAVPVTASPVFAQDVTAAICDPNNDGDRSDAIDPTACGIDNADEAQSTIGSIIHDVVQTLVFVVGGLSVVVIVIAGLMYVVSGGDGNNTKRAKDAIQYAIIGLIVAVVAQGLVSFVLTRL